MNSYGKLGLAVLAAALLGGCAEYRASYFEPNLPPNRLATLTGGWGYYVTQVDGDRVDSSNVQLGGVGGNTVKVEAGTHELMVSVTSGNPQWTRTTKWDFNCVLQGGHLYKIGPSSLLVTNLTVTDEQTNVSIDVQPIEDPNNSFF